MKNIKFILTIVIIFVVIFAAFGTGDTYAKGKSMEKVEPQLYTATTSTSTASTTVPLTATSTATSTATTTASVSTSTPVIGNIIPTQPPATASTEVNSIFSAPTSGTYGGNYYASTAFSDHMTRSLELFALLTACAGLILLFIKRLPARYRSKSLKPNY